MMIDLPTCLIPNRDSASPYSDLDQKPSMISPHSVIMVSSSRRDNFEEKHQSSCMLDQLALIMDFPPMLPLRHSSIHGRDQYNDDGSQGRDLSLLIPSQERRRHNDIDYIGHLSTATSNNNIMRNKHPKLVTPSRDMLSSCSDLDHSPRRDAIEEMQLSFSMRDHLASPLACPPISNMIFNIDATDTATTGPMVAIWLHKLLLERGDTIAASETSFIYPLRIPAAPSWWKTFRRFSSLVLISLFHVLTSILNLPSSLEILRPCSTHQDAMLSKKCTDRYA